MKKNLFSILVLLGSVIFFSCNKSQGKVNVDFGAIRPNHMVEKTMTLNFNMEAKKDSSAYVEFEFLLHNGSIPNGIQFTINGIPQSSNRFKFYAKDFNGISQDVKIGIQFREDSKEQIYSGGLWIISASEELQSNIFYDTDDMPAVIGEPVITWKAECADPLPLWIKALIFLAILILVFWIFYYILSRPNMPLGPKTFKAGMLSFPDGNALIANVRLDKLKEFNISKAFADVEEGLILEPFDKFYNKKKRRFARIKNYTSNTEPRLLQDGKEDIVGVTQDLYHLDELKITTPDGKIYLIGYSNNQIIRTTSF